MAFVADVGNTTTNSALALASNAGVLSLDGGASVTTPGALTNTGAIGLQNDVGVATATTLTINSAAGFGTAGVVTGFVSVDSSLGNALLTFTQGGQLTDIAANSTLSLIGANAFVADAGATTSNSALALASNAGTLALAAGASLTTPGALTNTGTIDLNFFSITTTPSTSTLNVNGSTAGFGTGGLLTGQLNLGPNALLEFGQGGQFTGIAAGGVLSLVGANAFVADAGATTTNSALALSSNAGTLFLQNDASLTTPGALANTGSISLVNTAGTAAPTTLIINSAAGFGTAGVVTGQVNLSGNALLEFTGGGQLTNIAANGSLSLAGPNAFVADAGAITSNSALTGLASNAGTLSLADGASLTTTGALTNIGSIGLSTFGSTPATTLTINSTAGFGTSGVVTGQVALSGNSLLTFTQGGQLTSIAANGSLSLGGPNAFVADAGMTTGNSALTGLASNAGLLSLSSGASLNTTGGLSNTGSIFVTNPAGTTTTTTLATTGALTNSATAFIGQGGVVTASGGYTQTSGTTTNEGTLNTSNLSLASGSTFSEELGGSTTGTFGQVNATGAISLAAGGSFGALLNVSIGFGFAPTIGQQFDFIQNTGTAPISGTFAGLAEGATIDVGNNIFTISYMGGAGNDVVLTDTGVVCFASGTLISTTRGDVAVEVLRIGDKAVTASGALRPIVWIGHRVVECKALPVLSESWPVRIRAGAFGDDLPTRDLYLSPGHPVLVGSGANEVLVPIMCLINGTSIARVPVDTVTYWHVELDEHDILLAEGLPAESFLDYGNRPWFENAADHALTNPDFIPPGLGGRCRPVAVDGPIVEIERRRLAQQFQTYITAQCAWPAADGASPWF